MTVNIEFQRVREWNWLRGFANLLRKETQAWWRTRRWLINAFLWTGILGGLTANILFMPTLLSQASAQEIAQAGGETAYLTMQGLGILFELGSQILSLGAVVLCMDVLLEEKRSGLSEWILSKPVMRRAYILAKLIANLAHILLFLVALPSTLIYALLALRAGSLFSPLPFLAGVGIMTLHILFYVALTVLLGVSFNSRPPILGIAFGSLFGGGMIGGFIKPLLYITPWMLPKVSTTIASSQQMPTELVWLPLGFTALWCVLFILTAVYRFEKEEF